MPPPATPAQMVLPPNTIRIEGSGLAFQSQGCIAQGQFVWASGSGLTAMHPLLPLAQFWHVESAIAPVEAEYLAAAQFWHVESDVAPSVVEYFPAAQV